MFFGGQGGWKRAWDIVTKKRGEYRNTAKQYKMVEADKSHELEVVWLCLAIF